MTDFTDLPKQWVLSEQALGPATYGHEDRFGGFWIQAASAVPILRLVSSDGQEVGGYSAIYLKGADPALETRSHNLYTGLAHWQSIRYGWKMATGEATLPIGGRPARPGVDMRPIITTELAPLFPGFSDWDRDIDGALVDWERPPIGCSTAL